MRILFMGTPEFAVASLAALMEHGFNIVGVVTAPDRPAGRGLKMKESAVKKYAIKNNLPVLQPQKLKNPEFIETLRSYQADLQIVVAFRMLPEIVWRMPSKGTINLHASLLPQYRGAAPINHAIINGEKESGVTTFLLQHEIDTGKIIDQQKVEITSDEDAGQLHDKLMEAGAALLIRTVTKVKAGNVTYIPQSTLSQDRVLHPAPKIHKPDCRIDWHWDVDKIYDHIRGLSPYPGAWTTLNGKPLKIFKAEKTPSSLNEKEEPGSVETDQQNFVKIAGRNGHLLLKEIQPAGKKRMEINDFLRGYRKAWNIE